MSVEQLLEEFGRLTEPEREAFLQGAGLVAQDLELEESPEFIAFVEEGIRSAEEEPTITLEELKRQMASWPTRSS